MDNANFSWVDTNLVLPNPKNPRRDAEVKVDEMINILKNRGWEQAISVYKNDFGPYYTIISGHRRWTAAKKMGLKEIPIYVRPRPKDEVEETERLGDIQRGQVDWNEYEWAEYTTNIYSQLNMSYDQLGRRMNVSGAIIAARVRVYTYYPRIEIEAKLANRTYTLRMLDYIRQWIEKLKKYQSNLIAGIGEDRVRQLLLQKYENRVLNSYIHLDEYVEKLPEAMIFDFIVTPNKKLVDLKREFESQSQVKKVVNLKYNKKKLKSTLKEIEIITPRNKREAEVLIDSLSSLKERIELQKQHFAEMMKQNKKSRKGVALK